MTDRCATCRRWMPPTAADRAFHGVPDDWRWCALMAAYDEGSEPVGLGGVPGSPVVAVDCYGTGDPVKVATAPGFGCTEHEPA